MDEGKQKATTERRDPGKVARALRPWLAARVAGNRVVDCMRVAAPHGHGFSNDTLFVDAVVDGEDLRLVVQAAPIGPSLFPEYAIELMARVQSDLRAHSKVPVAAVRWSEPDNTVLGAPFYVMDRVEGRVPDESPMPYHAAGWVADASAPERQSMWSSVLDALGALHRVEVDHRFAYLTGSRWGMPLDADPARERVRQWRSYSEWASGREAPSPRLLSAWDRLAATAPVRPARLGIAWGDAKLGNVMFRDLEVVALFDWELVGIGPAEEDLMGLLVVDTVLAAFAKVPRAAGFASVDETVTRYERILGREMIGTAWWYAFGVAKMAAETDRILRRFKALGSLPADIDLDAVNIAVPHLEPALDAVS